MPHEKLKEALHYVIENCPDASRLGAIRLNKILWFADCHAFRENGVSITGDTYLKRKFGPVPKHVLAALRDLEGEGKVVVREVPYSTRKTYREFISRTNPDTHGLSEADRDLLKGYAEVICERFTAAAISDASHDQVWEAADEGEEIPLYAIFASQAGAITDDVRAWANEVVGKLAA
ncbi:Panacea domain-containing protein [Novosphingobium colocasiae]|uniref:Antitoxin SocA-like Panacea domain-containing protein n=1 Tax=Novosphingobium colocasiae TaxID=1256513 RepID=A0A918PAK0_9SPHN|nr:Panacea domain-containing protein [Novosphingobium colocasiae]GGY95625.1 hypothetical protein GCM10011614_07930 [Novosphingobium colocasiae]